MAQLKDSIVTGSLRVTDTIYTTDLQIFSSKTAAYVLASPTSASGAPTFRALATTDIPTLSITAGTTGTLTIARGGTGVTTATAHYALLGPKSGNAVAPTWRAIDASDLPAIGNISNTGIVGSTASYGVVTDSNKKLTVIDMTVSAPNASGSSTVFVSSVTSSS